MNDTQVKTVPTGCLTIPSTQSRLRKQIRQMAKKGYQPTSQVKTGGKIVVTYTRPQHTPPPQPGHPRLPPPPG